jgi:hypothetical protein
MGVAIIFQPLNSFHLYVVSIVVLILQFIIEKEKWSISIKKLLLYLGPCLVIALICFIRIQLSNPISGTSLISVADWWNFAFANEPDDVSLAFRQALFGYNQEMFFSLIALLWIALNIVIINRRFPKYGIVSKAILIMAGLFIVVAWCEFAFALFWERFLVYFPDFVNDIFIALNFHDQTYISSLFYFPVFGLAIVQIIMAIADLIISKAVPWLRSTVKWLMDDKRLASLLFIILVSSSVLLSTQFYNPRNVAKYWQTGHQPYSFFADEIGYEYIYDFSPLTWPSLVDAGEWIRDNTPKDSMMFTLPYVKEAAVLADRFYFLSEKFDGDMACLNRKFATQYLIKFSDLLDGLSYENLFNGYGEGGDGYAQIRAKYLSLTTEDFRYLAEKYPGYDYILTEKGHELDFELIYSNSELLVYKM